MDVTAATTLFAWLDPEVWLVTAQANDRRGGLIATFVSQASSVPDMPRLLVGLSKHHFTTELVLASRAFALHLLSEDNLDLIWRFGLESGRDIDKFSELEVDSSSTGSPVLSTTVGWIDCRVETTMDIGDRILLIGEVIEGQVNNFAPPLTSRRLMERSPSAMLTQMQRRRHLDSYRETEAIRAWREREQP